MTPEEIREKFPIGSKWIRDTKEVVTVIAHTSKAYPVFEYDCGMAEDLDENKLSKCTPYIEPKIITGYVNVYGDRCGSKCFDNLEDAKLCGVDETTQTLKLTITDGVPTVEVVE